MRVQSNAVLSPRGYVMNTKFKGFKIVAIALLLSLMVATLSGCGFFAFYGEEDLHAMMDEIAVSMLTGDGISTNILLANPDALGLQDQPATLPLPVFNKREYEQGLSSVKQITNMFKLVNKRQLSQKGRCDLDTVNDYFTTYSERGDFYYLDNRGYIGTSNGWNVMLPLYLDKLEFKTVNDIQNWISLLNQTENAFAQYAKFEREVLIPAGYERSISTYREIAEQCAEMCQVENNGRHYLYELFVDKINKVSFIDGNMKIAFQQNAMRGISTMISAYEALAREMNLCATISKTEIEKPIAQYDDGRAYYRFLFKDSASTDDSVTTASTLLMSELQKVISEYQAIRQQISEGVTLRQDMSMTTLQGHYATLKSRYTEDFPALSTSTPDATFFAVPESMADFYNPASYFKSAVDSLTAPETIYINESNAGGYLGFDIISHEGIPGHMLQHAYYKSTGANMLRTLLGYTGYAEGWASYAQFYSAKYFIGSEAERLAYKAECLNDKASLYVSTLIDIEINYNGKTLQDLQKDAFYSQFFDGSEESKETYNYMVQNPAVYASYGYGNYKMEKLREKYDGTDLEFHTAVLTIGPTTYEILEQYLLGEGKDSIKNGWLYGGIL